MKNEPITRDELVEQMKKLGNRPVVFLRAGQVKEAIREAVLVHNPTVIGLMPAGPSDIGITQSEIEGVREELRNAKNRFSSTYEEFVERDSPIAPRQFNVVKAQYDAAIDRAIELLSKLTQ